MADTVLVFGAGWLGGLLVETLSGAVWVTVDIADPAAVDAALDRVGPTHVVNAAGKTGRPNVDALEGHPASTLRSNVWGPVVLAEACRARDIHLTHLSSGCLYQGDKDGQGWSETDPPTFDGSLYARSKAQAERLLAEFDVLQLRVRLPFHTRPHARNLLTKLLAFQHVVRIPNSVTVLDDLWAPMQALLGARETGIWNLVNPGIETHDEVLQTWQARVDPTHAFDVIPVEALARSLVAPRSNCLLSTRKLEQAGLAPPAFPDRLAALVDAYARSSSVAPRT